jgi:hypothetical protein
MLKWFVLRLISQNLIEPIVCISNKEFGYKYVGRVRGGEKGVAEDEEVAVPVVYGIGLHLLPFC